MAINVQDEQGNTHVFPDEATPEMIAKAMGVSPPHVSSGAGGSWEPESAITRFGRGAWGALNGALQSGVNGVSNEVVPTDAQGNAMPPSFGSMKSELGGLWDSVSAAKERNVGDYAGATGKILTNLAMMGKPAAEGSAPARGVLGDAMQSGGANLIDRTAGSLKSDFSHGAQPGRAYLDGGGGPAFTMRGLADKAAAVQDKAGVGLGDAYANATTRIPASSVQDAVMSPVDRLRTLQESPGGTGASPQLDAYTDRLMPPIDAAASRGGFTPSELFSQVKKPLSQNTRWNDPTMFDLNTVRQQGTGAVGGLLTDAVPETGPLNQIYQGSGRLADRAGARADTGSVPLTQMGRRAIEAVGGAGIGGVGYATGHPILGAVLGSLPALADTVPLKTAAAWMLYKGGKAIAPDAMSSVMQGNPTPFQGPPATPPSTPLGLPPMTIAGPPPSVAGYLPETASTGMQSVPTDIQGNPFIPRLGRKALPQPSYIPLGPGKR